MYDPPLFAGPCEDRRIVSYSLPAQRPLAAYRGDLLKRSPTRPYRGRNLFRPYLQFKTEGEVSSTVRPSLERRDTYDLTLQSSYAPPTPYGLPSYTKPATSLHTTNSSATWTEITTTPIADCTPVDFDPYFWWSRSLLLYCCAMVVGL